MLPKESQVKITASSEVNHPTLKKNLWTINRRNEFIFHTKPGDLKPEVIIRFSEGTILDGDVVYLYNRTGTSEIAERLLGVQFHISSDGISWESVNVAIGDNNVYDRVPIKIEMSGKSYLKISRHESGPPIHFSQITLGIAIHEKEQFDINLTGKFATKYHLPVGPNGQIIENAARNRYINIRSSLFDTKRINGVSNISALQIVHLGRFANALIQLRHALSLAKKFGIRKIYLPNNDRAKQMFERGFPVICGNLGVEICIPENDAELLAETTIIGYFFYLTKYKGLMRWSLNPFVSARLYKHGLGFDYGVNDAINENELVIHIRSGDIFDKYPHPLYGQPPAAYYIKIIEMVVPKVVHLVFEDEANPVIGALRNLLCEKRIPVILQSSSLREDIQKILKARTLVAGRGTFVAGIVSLSDNVKTLYSFHSQIRVPEGAKNIVLDDVKGEFFNNVLSNNWRNTEAQRRLMLEYPVSAISVRQEGRPEMSVTDSQTR